MDQEISTTDRSARAETATGTVPLPPRPELNNGSVANSTTTTIFTTDPILHPSMTAPTESSRNGNCDQGQPATDGRESRHGSMKCRFLLPEVMIRGVSSETDEEWGGATTSEGDDDTDSGGEGEASARSLLGARRGGRTLRRKRGGRRALSGSVPTTRRRWWGDWRSTVGLWVVLIVLGSMIGFVVVENAEEEPGSEGKQRIFVLETLGQGGDARVTPPEGWFSYWRWVRVAAGERRGGKGCAGRYGMEWGSISGQVEEEEGRKRAQQAAVLKRRVGAGEGEDDGDEVLKNLLKREVPEDAEWLYTQNSSIYTTGPNSDSEHMIESRNGAVSSDVEVCSKIGVELMKKGGNAVDAVIGTAACIGTVNMFASGIGGGGFATIRLASGESRSFNFREMAPQAAHRDMFNSDPLLAQRSGLAFAIPGEVDGFWHIHKKYGKLPWRELWIPSIKLNKSGFKVTETLAERIAGEKEYFEKHRDEWSFLFSPKTGKLLVEGDVMKRPALAKTLTTIAGKNGVKKFYYGKIAKSLVRASRDAGGVVTEKDFRTFFTIEEETLTTKAFGREFVTCQAPCSGPVLIEALNIADLLNVTNPSDPATIHRVIEIMKWLSAGRTELGDPADTEVGNQDRVQELMTKDYAAAVRQNITDNTTYPWPHYNPSYEPNEPKGTSHISVLDQFGNAVALTTTVNLYWGALVHDVRTGIVLNSEMDDFSIPARPNAYGLRPSIYNYIKPRKRPLSSTAPTIAWERDGKPGLIIGASGGSRIVTSVFECIVKNYLWEYDLLDTIKSPRMHHQLLPEIVYVENGTSKEAIEELRLRGHEVAVVPRVGSVVQAVRRLGDGKIVAVADWWRKRGRAAGF